MAGREIRVSAGATGGNGTAEKPFGTIQEAMDGAEPGDTVLVAPGTYRESIRIRRGGEEGHPIHLKSQVRHGAVVTGTELLGSGALPLAMVGDDGEGLFRIPNYESPLPVSHGHGLPAGFGEQVFIDGMLHRPVLTPDRVAPGTFHVDRERKEILIRPGNFTGEYGAGRFEFSLGSIAGGQTRTLDRREAKDRWPFLTLPFVPGEHRVEVTTRSGLILAGNRKKKEEISHVHLSGFLFQGSGDAPQTAMVGFHGIGNRVEDCIFQYGAGRGLDFSGKGGMVRRCLMTHHGQMGMALYGEDHLVEDTTFSYNNHKHADFVCFEQGGCKNVRCRRCTLRRVRAIGNDGPGIWFDIENYENTIEGCTCIGNSGPGIMYEISFSATIRNNLCVNNGFPARKDMTFDSPVHSMGSPDPHYGQGILIQYSSDCLVAHNTCVGNRKSGIELRAHAYIPTRDGNGEPYGLTGNRILNNLLVDNGHDNLLLASPSSLPGSGSVVHGNVSDGNLFHDSRSLIEGPSPSTYMRFGKTMASGDRSLEEWRHLSGQDFHSLQWDPAFVSRDTGDYRLMPYSPAIGRGQPGTAVDKDHGGRTRRPGAPTIGAFEYLPGDEWNGSAEAPFPGQGGHGTAAGPERSA